MTAQQGSLFGPARRRRGAGESALRRSLAAWHPDGLLAGDEHAATRFALARLARAVDMAERGVTADPPTCSLYTFARITDMFRTAVLDVLEGREDDGESLDAELARLLRD